MEQLNDLDAQKADIARNITGTTGVDDVNVLPTDAGLPGANLDAEFDAFLQGQ